MKEQLVKTSVSDNISLMNKKISEMKAIETTKWLTPGKITMSNTSIDVKTESSIEKLMKGWANLKLQANALYDSYKDFEIEDYPAVLVDGGLLDDWKHDILLRIKIIKQKQILDEMTTIRDEWVSLMDKEDRKSILKDKMDKLLKS